MRNSVTQVYNKRIKIILYPFKNYTKLCLKIITALSFKFIGIMWTDSKSNHFFFPCQVFQNDEILIYKMHCIFGLGTYNMFRCLFKKKNSEKCLLNTSDNGLTDQYIRGLRFQAAGWSGFYQEHLVIISNTQSPLQIILCAC